MTGPHSVLVRVAILAALAPALTSCIMDKATQAAPPPRPPIYPGAKLTTDYTNGIQFDTYYSTGDQLDRVDAWYVENLPHGPWVVVGHAGPDIYIHSTANPTFDGTVNFSRENNQTIIHVTGD